MGSHNNTDHEQKSSAAILFDMDGTLIDSTDAIVGSIEESFHAHGLTPPSPDKIHSLVGHPLQEMFSMLDVPEELMEATIESYRIHFRRLGPVHTKLLTGAREAVILASQFARTAIVTTKTGWYTRELIKDLKIDEYIETVVGYEDVKYPKPHPEPVLKALNDLNLLRNGNVREGCMAYMIGDTFMDVSSARQAGIGSAALISGHGKMEDIIKENPDIICRDVNEAVMRIRSLTDHNDI